jgi:hypothetical protein
MEKIDSKHKMEPPRFVANAVSKSPSMINDQEVVMPHPGQRIPVIAAIVHLGKPSCVCVPIPEGSGSSHAAMDRTPMSKNAISPMCRRSLVVSLESLLAFD